MTVRDSASVVRSGADWYVLDPLYGEAPSGQPYVDAEVMQRLEPVLPRRGSVVRRDADWYVLDPPYGAKRATLCGC